MRHDERATVLVSGMVAGTPGQGGATWAVLQYLLGLRRLGHDVHLVEPVDVPDVAASPSARWCAGVAAQFGLDDRWCLVSRADGSTAGMHRRDLVALARRADVLLDVSGMLRDVGEVFDSPPVRAYLDLDPGFVQLWHAVSGVDMRFDGHTHFATVGLGIGQPGSPVPDCGLAWLPTLQPVVLEQWPRQDAIPRYGFTTVGNWRGYGSVEHDGVLYGQKAHSVRELLDIPARTRARLDVALAVHPAEEPDLAALRAAGWRLRDPAVLAGTVDAYRDFVQTSTGELGLAKSGYVHARCGWFSDRSTCYLASGRPVVAQDTGFDRYLPTGEGLLAFSDADSAGAGMDAVLADYPRHARAARALAEDVFDSDRVLPALLARLT
jgi:hypothetical protein